MAEDPMQIQRPTADIAYVIADAHSGLAVRLDRLRFGPETVVKTDVQGAYAISGRPVLCRAGLPVRTRAGERTP
jgi:hypothetical protein